jgi:hypothetical protein
LLFYFNPAFFKTGPGGARQVAVPVPGPENSYFNHHRTTQNFKNNDIYYFIAFFINFVILFQSSIFYNRTRWCPEGGCANARTSI